LELRWLRVGRGAEYPPEHELVDEPSVLAKLGAHSRVEAIALEK
jgi:hypothetical protein